MCKAFLPLVRGRGWGRIINMASATVAIASPVSIAYRTSKMGVIGFTRALSATLGDDGVTVNVMLPSLTRTAMSEGLPEAVVSNSLGRQVIHRMAEPDDIAGSVLILAGRTGCGGADEELCRVIPGLAVDLHQSGEVRRLRNVSRLTALVKTRLKPMPAGHAPRPWSD
jgi:NAD(P)-dependent dehydrogenase (short-subunit alcohol dehydrogenase family)